MKLEARSPSHPGFPRVQIWGISALSTLDWEVQAVLRLGVGVKDGLTCPNAGCKNGLVVSNGKLENTQKQQVKNCID